MFDINAKTAYFFIKDSGQLPAMKSISLVTSLRRLTDGYSTMRAARPVEPLQHRADTPTHTLIFTSIHPVPSSVSEERERRGAAMDTPFLLWQENT